MKNNRYFWPIVATLLLVFVWTKPLGMNQSKALKNPLPHYLADIKDRFEMGSFSHFLDQWHDFYLEKRKAWGFSDALEGKKAVCDAQKNQQFAPKPQEENTLFITEYKNALLALCSQHSQDPLAGELMQSLSLTLSKEEKAGADFMQSLKTKFLGDGKTPLENALIKLQTEYWLKKVALTSAMARGDFHPEDFRNNMIALEMEKMAKMEKACDEAIYPDPEIAMHIHHAKEATPKIQALHWANALVINQKKHGFSQNQELSPFEQELASFVASHS